MAQLGGHAQFIESRTTQIAHGDTAKEIGEILGRYNDGIAIRHVDWGEGNQYIRDVAAASRVPVLNMQCDLYHPFQILADLMTIIEKKGDLRGRTSITVSWAYAASYQKPISVPQELILAGHALRHERASSSIRPSSSSCPTIVERGARPTPAASGGSLEMLDDFDAGFRGADVVYAKSWGALLTAKDETEGAEIAKQYTDWITDERRMALANDDAICMHPLPADRNVEVADAVIDGPSRSSTTRPRTGSTPRRP